MVVYLLQERHPMAGGYGVPDDGLDECAVCLFSLQCKLCCSIGRGHSVCHAVLTLASLTTLEPVTMCEP